MGIETVLGDNVLTTKISEIANCGDVYDRYLVRMEEMWQSLKIVEQALENLPEGPFQVDDRRITLPPKRGAARDEKKARKQTGHRIAGPRSQTALQRSSKSSGFRCGHAGSVRPREAGCR